MRLLFVQNFSAQNRRGPFGTALPSVRRRCTFAIHSTPCVNRNHYSTTTSPLKPRIRLSLTRGCNRQIPPNSEALLEPALRASQVQVALPHPITCLRSYVIGDKTTVDVCILRLVDSLQRGLDAAMPIPVLVLRTTQGEPTLWCVGFKHQTWPWHPAKYLSQNGCMYRPHSGVQLPVLVLKTQKPQGIPLSVLWFSFSPKTKARGGARRVIFLDLPGKGQLTAMESFRLFARRKPPCSFHCLLALTAQRAQLC